jgi:ABC-2 type transport system ATP-binding protein
VLFRSGEGALQVVLGGRHGPITAEQVEAVVRAVPGVTGLERADGDGLGTVGFKVRFGAEDPRRALFDAVVKHDLVVLELRRTQVSLEDTFRKLTGAEAPRKAA